MNPWPGKKVIVRDSGNLVPVQLDKSNGECLIFLTTANHKYLVQPE